MFYYKITLISIIIIICTTWSLHSMTSHVWILNEQLLCDYRSYTLLTPQSITVYNDISCVYVSYI